MKTRSLLRQPVRLVLAALVIAASISLPGLPSAEARQSDGFELLLEVRDEQIVVVVRPGAEPIGSLSGSLRFDAAQLGGSTCTVSAGIGACEPSVGEVRFAVVAGTGWTAPTDIVTVEFGDRSFGGTTRLELIDIEATDAGGSPIAGAARAADLEGDDSTWPTRSARIIAGIVLVGVLAVLTRRIVMISRRTRRGA